MKYIDNTAKKKSFNVWWVVVPVIIVVIVIVALLVIRNLNRNMNGDNVGMVTDSELLTEGEINSTAEILEKFVELNVIGFDESRNSVNPNGAVGISVKNISDETVSIMFIMAAYLKDGEIADKHFIYAENIKPGETQIFDAFINTPLTPDELKLATFKVYQAEFYTPETGVEGVEAVTNNAETITEIDNAANN